MTEAEKSSPEISLAIYRAPRASLDEKVVFKPSRGLNCDGLVRDLSESGIYLVSRQRMSLGTEVVFYLNLPVQGARKLCIVSGEIVRVDVHPSNGLRGYGVRFGPDLPRSSKSLLEQFVSLRLSDPSSAS